MPLRQAVLAGIIAAGFTNTILPSFTGTLGAGQTLTYVPGTWVGSPTVTHEWYLNGAPFGSPETGATITGASVPAGGLISVIETANGVRTASSVAKYIALYSATNLSWAYGVRKLVAGYAGSAVDVVRTPDNATLTIGFLSNGELDQATALAFRTAGGVTAELRVSKIYDQSGAGLDVTQSSAGARMHLELYVMNGKPALWCDQSSLIFHATNAAYALTGDQTIVWVGAATGTDAYLVSSIDAAPGNGWILAQQSLGRFAYYSSTKGSFTNQSTGISQEGWQHSLIVTRESGTVSINIDGTLNGTASGHGNASAGAFAISGSPVDSTKKADKLFTEILGYSATTDAPTLAIWSGNHSSYYDTKTPTQSPSPIIGAHAYKIVASSYFDINAGSVLKWDANQNWTVEFLVRMRGRSRLKSIANGVSVSMIVGSMGNSPTAYPGWEVMFDCRGFLFFRLDNDYGAGLRLGGFGSQNFATDAWAVGHVSYIGTRLVSGFRCYKDGVRDTLVRTEIDLLGGGSIVSTNLSSVGNQPGSITVDGHYFRGTFNRFRILDFAVDDAYAAAHSTPATMTLANDPHCVVSYDFTEGSGAPQDGSGHGYHGVVTGSPVWT